ncbi:hypothetical protein [Methylomonas rosea]|uniref:Uncharacterized protein n=1 Tax=Methylomonas rosea TaxID=2952227 RepID=A0ABT1TSM3_9GAMM|nr:hypothetical protein [Methylomonas sp. WSC-7]MCQ8117578.1 hypothetical protein [Methylomonas sp. WSC-7]
MASIDSYLHLIGIELLVILAILGYLVEADLPKRVVSRLFLTVLGFMLAHLATHALPNQIAGFIYSSQHLYHSAKSPGLHRT